MKFPISLSRLALCFCVLTFLLAPIAAQKTAVLPFGNGEPQWSRLEGTLESTIDGVTARAKISVQGPGQMRLEIERDDDAQIAPQIIVTAPNETRIFNPLTKRIQRLPYNVLELRGWNLQSGGPANFVLARFADALSLPAEGRSEYKGFPQSFVSDYVRFGGSGDRIFYAPYKKMQADGPARVLLEWKGGGPVQTRTAFDEGGGVLSRATLTTDNAGLPTGAVVVDAKNRQFAEFKYALTKRAEPFPDTTFSFDFAPGQIVEDVQVKAISAYSGSDANSKFNRGAALMWQAEELSAAFAAWEEAAAAAPQASAPSFAIYDTALAARDLDRAETALRKLEQLLGSDSFPVMWRRTGVLLARRDWAGAQSTLEAAAKAQPKNLQVKLSLADVLRSRGNFADAQAQLLEILQSDLPQSATQAQAAQMLAELASGSAATGVLAALGKEAPTETLWQKVARVAIALRRGEKATLVGTEDAEALIVLATEFERASHDDEALAAWQKVIEVAPSPTDEIARARLMTLFARRGDVASSLAQYREAVAASTGLQNQRIWQENLIAAWGKAFRPDLLKTALEQRSLASNATADDARLWLTFLENYGTPEEISAAIQNGLARFTRDAWWRARQSEQLMEQAARALDTPTTDRFQREALDFVETAAALEPDQPYYAIQRAMILTQRATPVRGVLRPGADDGAKKIAHAALDEILKKWPDDADVQIAVASQRLALEDDGAHADSIALLETALRGGAPSPSENRHFIAFSSRQILISALRRDRKWDALTPQYEILFRASRSGSEQLGVALNYLRLLLNRDDPDKIADLLIYFARQSWPFEESQQMMLPLINVVAVSNKVLAPTIIALEKSSDPYARLVLAQLHGNLARSARAVLAAPEAPDRAERDVIAAETNLSAALGQLAPLVESNDKILASRAAAILGEAAMNRSAPADAEKWMARAVALEPRDVNLRVALAMALQAQAKTKAALAARDEMLRALPHTFDALHRAAKLSLNIGETSEKEFTARLASQAFRLSAAAPEISSGTWQLAAFTAARAAFDAGQTSAALALYNALASPQWNDIERGVALIDLEESYKIAGQNEQAATAAARLEALGLTPQQRARAEDIWASLSD